MTHHLFIKAGREAGMGWRIKSHAVHLLRIFPMRGMAYRVLQRNDRHWLKYNLGWR